MSESPFSEIRGMKYVQKALDMKKWVNLKWRQQEDTLSLQHQDEDDAQVWKMSLLILQ